MSEVLEISYGVLDNPITEKNSGAFINGICYVNTPTKVYRVDVVNNTSEVVTNKTDTTEYICTTYGTALSTFEKLSNGNYAENTFSVGTGGQRQGNTIYNAPNMELIGIATTKSPAAVEDYLYAFFIDKSTNKLRVFRREQDSSYYSFNEVSLSNIPNMYNDYLDRFVQFTQIGTAFLDFSSEYSVLTTYDGNTVEFVKQNYPEKILTNNGQYATILRNANTTESIQYIIGYDLDNGKSYIKAYKRRPNTLETTPYYINKKIDGRYAIQNGDDYYIFIDEGYIKFSFVEYNLKYTIKSNDGLTTLSTISNATPIQKLRFGYDGTQVSYIYYSYGDTYSQVYTPTIPEGYTLVGYSVSPNSKTVDFPLNTTIENYINTDITFYEVYDIYRPPKTTLGINLYKNSAEPNRVDKTNYLEQIGTLYGAFRDETSITNPIITIQQTEAPQFNYVYIPIFNRYYYVTDITSIRYGLWEISLSVDVLMTYKDAIKSCYAFVDRNEFTYNDILTDKKRVIEQGYDIETITIRNDLFDPNSNGDFVLEGLGFGSLVGDLYSITTDLTNVTADENNPTNIGSSEQIALSFRLEEGYLFPSQNDTSNFSVTNATIVSWDNSIDGGLLIISNATGNVTITIKGVAING